MNSFMLRRMQILFCTRARSILVVKVQYYVYWYVEHVRSTPTVFSCCVKTTRSTVCDVILPSCRYAPPHFTLLLAQADLPAPPRKKRTVEMAQGKWAEILIHTDRVTKVTNQKSNRDIGQCSALLFLIPGTDSNHCVFRVAFHRSAL